jgi:hypothetical protein
VRRLISFAQGKVFLLCPQLVIRLSDLSSHVLRICHLTVFFLLLLRFAQVWWLASSKRDKNNIWGQYYESWHVNMAQVSTL